MQALKVLIAFVSGGVMLALLSGCAQTATKQAIAEAPWNRQIQECGIVRGPLAEKQIALVFTGHTFGEGGEAILQELKHYHAHGSFFLTGVFLDHPEFQPLVRKIVAGQHYLGPHSDQHLLYCPWEGPKTNLVTREAFDRDLAANLKKIRQFTGERAKLDFWLPAYEYYNCDIAKWSREDFGLTLINYTPGTRSNADYTGEHDKNFVSSQTIYDSILKKEHDDPNGLNGFILLTHIGVGGGRADKFSARFGDLLKELKARGYQFVRVDEMLAKR